MTAGGRAYPDRSESFGEELLGVLLDGAHELPPHLVGPLVAETVARMGDVTRRSCFRTTDSNSWSPCPPTAWPPVIRCPSTGPKPAGASWSHAPSKS